MRKISWLILLLLFNKVTVAQINIATGGGGAITGVAQSYNENRGAEVLVLSPVNITIQSMTLGGFFCGSNGGTDSAYLGARIYNASTAALLASANDSVYNIQGANVTIPISYTLISGSTYRVSVYCWGPHPPTGNSGLMYDPATVPYTEPSGMLQIMHGYDVSYDTMPYNNNIYVPLITLNVAITGVDEINLTNTFSIYPNPATKNLVVSFSSASGGLSSAATLVITNVLGQTASPPIPLSKGEGRIEVDISALASGVYFVVLQAEEGSVTARFVKQ